MSDEDSAYIESGSFCNCHDGANYILSDLDDRGLSNVAATLCMLLGYHPPDIFDPSLTNLVNEWLVMTKPLLNI